MISAAAPPGERIAAVETELRLLRDRVEQISERTHAQGNMLGVLTGQMEHAVDSLGRIETSIAGNRAAAAAEHALVRADLAPVRADYLDRVAVAAERERRRRLRHPFYVGLIGLGGVVAAWSAWFLGWGPKP